MSVLSLFVFASVLSLVFISVGLSGAAGAVCVSAVLSGESPKLFEEPLEPIAMSFLRSVSPTLTLLLLMVRVA